MTCGIHLYIEKRNRKRNTNWYQSSFRGEFTDIGPDVTEYSKIIKGK